MTFHPPRAITSVVVSAAVLFVLVACAPSAAPSTEPTAESPAIAATVSTPTPSPIDTVAPAALLNLSCDSFATAAQVKEAFGQVVTEVPIGDLASGDLANVTNALPASDYVRQAGGVECLWDNSSDDNYRFTGVPRPSLEINVAFGAQSSWQLYQHRMGFSGPTHAGCDIGICQEDDLMGGQIWVDVLLLEPKPATQSSVFQKVVAQTLHAIKAAGAPAALAALDPATRAVGPNCPDFVTDADVTSAIGVSVVSSTPIGYLEDQGTYSTWDAAQDTLQDHTCVWKHGGTTIGNIAWLPGGAWAWTEAQSHPLAKAVATKLAVPGLKPGDSAVLRCSTAGKSCVADLVLGGNWVEANLAPVGTSSKQAAITALAAAIVAKLG